MLEGVRAALPHAQRGEEIQGEGLSLGGATGSAKNQSQWSS